ncbi:MAG: hypothetical protein QXX15_02980 [Desulfurococcaceae archaeon]
MKIDAAGEVIKFLEDMKGKQLKFRDRPIELRRVLRKQSFIVEVKFLDTGEVKQYRPSEFYYQVMKFNLVRASEDVA